MMHLTFSLLVCAQLLLLKLVRCNIDPTQAYERFFDLDGVGNVKLYWKYTDTHITFELHGQTTGWIGIGFSPTGGMRGADIIVGWVKNGNAVISDRHGVGNTFPPRDDQQNVELLTGAECNGWTMLKFVRPLRTCDENDRQITKNTMKVIYAFGAADPTDDDLTPINYHRMNKGVRSMILLEGPRFVTPLVPSETHSSFDILNNVSAIPARKTYYNCMLVRLPTLPTKHHVIKFEPLIQPGNERFVHHMLLHLCTKNEKDVTLLNTNHECYRLTSPADFSDCVQIIAAWAVGGGPHILPPHVGYPLGNTSEPVYAMLEMHYDNPNLISGVSDQSGMRIYYTPELRQYDVGILTIGQIVNSYSNIIPPTISSFKHYGDCPAECLETVMDEIGVDHIKVVGGFLHSHLLGRKLRVRHLRNGTELPNILRDDSYDFDYQEGHSLTEEVIIRKGDALQVVCDYDSSGRSTYTTVGLATENEMCLGFLTYYPKVPLSICETSPYLLELLQYFGVHLAGFKRYSLNYGKMDDILVRKPNEFRFKSFGSILSQQRWTRARADHYSEAVSRMHRSRMCIVNGVWLHMGLYRTQALQIQHPLTERQPVCTTANPTGIITEIYILNACPEVTP
uniref:DBH-like monooxygenase protein 1 homolog n=1 Tax=Ciona intestinalis TaxID=7719 RepID=UPI00089DC91A|nr:DBH-like monooxygenase protein 1 homolog [Ciona intestinalis]|eukprot:XP_018667907.1 DBH-like monooxygenase protein 1 homolog [Ciona intestinalis]